jgi:hypothetical protein
MDTAAGPITASEDSAAADAAPPPAPPAPPTSPALAPDFDALHATYSEASKGWDTLPEDYTNEQSDAVAAAVEPAREALFACPAPTPFALLQKLRVAMAVEPPRPDEMAWIMKDAQRLLDRRPVAGIMTGVSFALCAAASDWAQGLRRADAAGGDDLVVDEEIEKASATVRSIENFRCTTLGDLELKMRVICAEYFDVRLPEQEGYFPEPVFDERGDVVPGRVMKSIFQDIQALGRRAEIRDKAIIVEAAAEMVSDEANKAICAALYTETLIGAIRALLDNEVGTVTRGEWGLPGIVKENLSHAVDDLERLLDLTEDQVGIALKSARGIEEADLLRFVRDGRR